MGIEINFTGQLQSHRIDEFHTALEKLLESIEGTVSRSEFYLPDDVTSHISEIDDVLRPANQVYPRKAHGEKVLVWKVSAPSFFNCAFAICCNIDWQGALVLYDNKNWGSAYPLVSEEERLDNCGHDPTIHEIPVCIRRSDKLQGHLDAVKIADLIKKHFVPDLWVDDDTGYYEKRDIEELKRGINMIGAFVPPVSKKTAPAPHISRSVSPGDSKKIKELNRTVNAALLIAPIDKLDLGTRYTNSLKREGILTIGDLSKKKLSELKSIKNIGEQTIRQINVLMLFLGFPLSE